ncbi:MAG: hypothetical protein GY797_13840 [Deltaproteobacteria bacterium]|nr:hypothetical protein [Deltaproteobacteria bacterium]
MTHSAITKNRFLKNLEKALKQLICNRLHENENEAQKQVLAMNVEEFIRENASHYSLEELKETFISADASIGLFLEYQDAKMICEGTDEKGGKSGGQPDL